VTTTKDDRVFQELQRKIRDVGKARVSVGVFGGGDIAEVAAIHEYGAPAAGIPERSFLRRAFAEQSGAEALQKFLVRTAKTLIAEKLEVPTALERLGQFAVAQVKNRIKAVIPPTLKPETIKRKGSSTPLVDTGQLLNSVTHEVK